MRFIIGFGFGIWIDDLVRVRDWGSGSEICDNDWVSEFEIGIMN